MINIQENQKLNKQSFDFLNSISQSRISLRKFYNSSKNQLDYNARAIEKLTAEKRLGVSEHGNMMLSEAIRPLSVSDRCAAFVCPHWGNYVSSFVQIAFSCPDGSQFVTLRGDQWSGDEDKFWAVLNSISNRKIVVARKRSRTDLLYLAKAMKSGASLFLLFDLHHEFGATGPINFFGSEIRITSGWTDLCYISESVVVFIAPNSIDRKAVEIIDVIDPRAFETREEFCEQCMKCASACLENLVRENPAYWFMWDHMGKYLINE